MFNVKIKISIAPALSSWRLGIADSGLPHAMRTSNYVATFRILYKVGLDITKNLCGQLTNLPGKDL